MCILALVDVLVLTATGVKKAYQQRSSPHLVMQVPSQATRTLNVTTVQLRRSKRFDVFSNRENTHHTYYLLVHLTRCSWMC